MHSAPLDSRFGPPSLAVLNHRGEALDTLQGEFRARGWQVHASRELTRSVELLRAETPTAALIAPLTLSPHTLEWELLLDLLSPRTAVPWLLVPWAEAPPQAVAALLREREAVADWLVPPAELSQADARLQNLMRLEAMLAQSRSRNAALEGQLITDHKTGLFNDRHFRARLAEEFERTVRHGSPLSLLLLDLDDFKGINDSTSYESGDRALGSIGEVLRRSVRAIDIPARIGGDEFAVLMPNTGLEEAVSVAMRIRTSTRHSRVETELGFLTLHHSQGVACFAGQGMKEERELFLRANEALKAAKQAGKDQVSFFDARRRQPVAASRAVEPPAGRAKESGAD